MHATCCSAPTEEGIFSGAVTKLQGYKAHESSSPVRDVILQLNFAERLLNSTEDDDSDDQSTDVNAGAATSSVGDSVGADVEATSSDGDDQGDSKSEGSDEVTESSVLKALAILEAIINALRSEAEEWLRDVDSDGIISDASRAILWAKALVMASQGRSFLGDSEASISFAWWRIQI